ncbi:MAG: DUF3189 family protein [Bacillota bacterium]
MKIIFYNSKTNKLAKLIAYRYLKENDLEKVKEIFLETKIIPKKNLLVLGTSDEGHDIAVLGCHNQKKIVFNLIAKLNELFEIKEKLILVDTDIVNNYLFKLGKLAIKLNLESLGLLLIRAELSNQKELIDKIIKETKEQVEKERVKK